MQEVVGGWIEPLNISNRVAIIMNEEGKMMDLPANFCYGPHNIVGPVVFVGKNLADYTGLSDNEIAGVKKFFLEVND